MANRFSPTSLPDAIATLFRENDYDVRGPIQLHGAEVDLVATPIGNPFSPRVYIEATVEHVDNQKYGKDVGKLALVKQLEPDARCLIVSSTGFSLPVRERAEKTRIETLTYDELFSKFERFEPYVKAILDEGPMKSELKVLNDIYEEPEFEDSIGRAEAVKWLTTWRNESDEKRRWLIIVGEYGTGKTALTKILQYRWTADYRDNTALPVPFRIELRDFSRQFDALGLLHHFADHNNLGHVPIQFISSLIKRGRVVLLLDGYDEMAQYLSARERRACLEALAHLSADGAKGILTSRPNYFSEAEEFHIFDILYSSLEKGTYYLTAQDREDLKRERELDEFIESHFLERYERTLRDLSPEQTEELVGRALSDDPHGKEVVVEILRRVFRSTDEGAAVSLSGKPVIIAYLLEVVEQLKNRNRDEQGLLTEWDVYKLIVDQLMIRDLRQAGQVFPDKRRAFYRH